jgi:hypothetical protein
MKQEYSFYGSNHSLDGSPILTKNKSFKLLVFDNNLKIRNSYYSSEDCIENRYIQFIREDQEKQCKLTILSIFLPKSLRDIIKYTIASYL